jgi:hypothetical protein
MVLVLVTFVNVVTFLVTFVVLFKTGTVTFSSFVSLKV